MFYLLYDDHCGLCAHLKRWLMMQSTQIPLTLVPWHSSAARRMFPNIVTGAEPTELIVISSQGEVWRNEKAWLMVFHSLDGYANLAKRIATPALLPLVRQLFILVSHKRKAVSTLFGLGSEVQVAKALHQIAIPECELGSKGRHGGKV
jgi:predicted DCC family thiol-disulfide oxidoreductase YuxK